MEVHLFGLVAQSVEQRTENPCVGGSIPSRAIFKNKLKACFFMLFFNPLVSFIEIGIA